ncbi:MAG: hypothetical protein IKG81_05265 [Bacteroidales bacterium]|nr:hypothetical protein [Bacteroidales bacterium]
MKIESIQYYDGFDSLITDVIPSVVFDYDFVSINDVILMIYGTLSIMHARQCFIWLDTARYIFLSGTTYDVHYHGHIDNLKKLMSK